MSEGKQVLYFMAALVFTGLLFVFLCQAGCARWAHAESDSLPLWCLVR